MSQKLISIVTPFYNEEDVIENYIKSLDEVFSKIDNVTHEIIAVDDGSSDQTFTILKHLRSDKKNIKIIKLSRNFGKEIALTAGFDIAFGDAVIPMDADLQDSPQVICQMIQKWQEGAKVVLAQRKKRNDSFCKNLSAAIFYKFAGRVMKDAVQKNVGDFRLLDRVVADEVRKMREKTRFMRGIFSWVGYKPEMVYFERSKRQNGQAKQSYKKVTKYALDGIFSFSAFPIRLITYSGLSLSLISFTYGAFIILNKIFFNQSVPGYPSLMSVILFVSGINFIFIGVIGEYVGRIFNEVKARPLYVIEEILDK